MQIRQLEHRMILKLGARGEFAVENISFLLESYACRGDNDLKKVSRY